MRALVGCALGVLMVVSVGVAQEKVDGKKLIGKWQPADKKDNVTIEFSDKGKLVITVDVGGKAEKIEGTYKLDGNKLSVVVPFGGKEEKEEITVNKLTDEEMETTDSKGKKETLKKVK
jgi:uncharacterized protein (TIGR03066 family)